MTRIPSLSYVQIVKARQRAILAATKNGTQTLAPPARAGVTRIGADSRRSFLFGSISVNLRESAVPAFYPPPAGGFVDLPLESRHREAAPSS